MKRTVFYIKPNEQSAALFQSIVNKIAIPCNGPTFSPHLTFYTGQLSDDESAEELLKDSIKEVRSILLKPKAIAFSDTFTRSFYLSFELPEVLKNLSDHLKSQTEFSADYELNPHLSLAYTSSSLGLRQDIAKQIPEFNEPILFDSVGALQTPDSVTCFDDIKKSKHIATFNLFP